MEDMKVLTNSKVLQLRSQPEEEQQRPTILFANIVSSRVRPPKAPHQSTTIKIQNYKLKEINEALIYKYKISLLTWIFRFSLSNRKLLSKSIS